ncbi:MAG: Maf family protein [Lachnospiraceae bacterium]
MKMILASASPRRKELLAQAGYDFTVEVSQAKEDVIPASPGQLVEHLSAIKAKAVALSHMEEGGSGEDEMIIGADTIVIMDGEILGKPKDDEDALRILKELSGRTHQVYTGVTLIRLREGKIISSKSFSECTDVTMRNLSEEEIRAYIVTGEPADKAGAYGIQGRAAVFVSGIRGDYYNVVGLPICRLTEEINNERD